MAHHPFNEDFFDELVRLDEAALAPIIPAGFRPTAEEALAKGKLSETFVGNAGALIREIGLASEHRYALSGNFRLQAHHAYDFEPDRAFHSQYNVAFTGQPSDGVRGMRVGVGFRMVAAASSPGRIEYAHFDWKLRESQPDFNAAMQALNGGYVEIADKCVAPATAQTLLSARLRAAEEWRFFGAWFDATKIEALGVAELAHRCVEVFDILNSHGFGARYG